MELTQPHSLAVDVEICKLSDGGDALQRTMRVTSAEVLLRTECGRCVPLTHSSGSLRRWAIRGRVGVAVARWSDVQPALSRPI